MEDRMSHVKPDEFPLGNRKLQVVLEDFEFVGTSDVTGGPKIVCHDETAAPDVLTEIRDFLIIQSEEAGLGEIKEGILEDFGVIEPDNFVGIRRHVDTGELMYESDKQLIGKGVVMMPGRIVGKVLRPDAPGVPVGAL